MWTKKYVIVMQKISKKLGHHQMGNLRLKCIENFSIQEI
jgi:hypothetical protein